MKTPRKTSRILHSSSEKLNNSRSQQGGRKHKHLRQWRLLHSVTNIKSDESLKSLNDGLWRPYLDQLQHLNWKLTYRIQNCVWKEFYLASLRTNAKIKNSKAEIIPGCETPKIFPYKNVMKVITSINIGEVLNFQNLAN